MYRHSNHNRFRGNGGRNRFSRNGANQRPNRNFSRGQRRVKSFDPSDLVRNAPRPNGEVKAYVATNSFSSLPIDDTLKRNIAAKGYGTPTPIQDQAIPHILDGKDVIGIANTGTGKTAAFLIPLLNEVIKNRQKKVLIIAPTRELAFQIKNEFIEFAQGTGIYCALLIGGTNFYRQRNDLQRNPNFVIGTPGRLRDMINQKSLNLSSFAIVVLDEVDQMVDIGFIEDIKYFIQLMAKERQSLFFSATIGGKIKEILANFVRNPITVSVKKQDLLHNIRHDVVRISDKNSKIDHLHEFLNKKEFEKVLIFGRTKWGVQRLLNELIKRGFNADAIHGDKRQSQRLRILDKFKRNDIQILLATDVAARGLDIDNVSHVINYDPPESYEVYIHRIGRTGRADKTGSALTFV